MYEVKFIGGPLNGQRKIMRGTDWQNPSPIINVRLKNTATLSEKGSVISQVNNDEAMFEYSLYDNWPIRYKLKSLVDVEKSLKTKGK